MSPAESPLNPASFGEYLAAKGFSQNTVNTYALLAGRYKRSGLNGGFWNQPLDPNTKRNYYFALKQYDSFSGGAICEGVTPPPPKKLLPKSLLPAEVEKLQRVITGKERDLKMKALFCLLAGSGLRISEAVNFLAAVF